MPIPAHPEHVFAAMPEAARATALRLRDMIFEQAEAIGLAPPEETLKWGEPAYLPGRSGTTIRLGYDAKSGRCKLLVHCQTRLVEGWRARFTGRLVFEGNRAVALDPAAALDEAALRICIAEALTYHRRVRTKAAMERTHG
ncbi:MAG: DUF1801 domain-containing protein [Pseudomonadota bacterium]